MRRLPANGSVSPVFYRSKIRCYCTETLHENARNQSKQIGFLIHGYAREGYVHVCSRRLVVKYVENEDHVMAELNEKSR